MSKDSYGDTNYIICMKWGTKYGAEYVNRLYNMVKRNLTLPFYDGVSNRQQHRHS